MKDKLVDILECLGIYEVTANSETIADHLIANDVVVRAKCEWIPVMERLKRGDELYKSWRENDERNFIPWKDG